MPFRFGTLVGACWLSLLASGYGCAPKAEQDPIATLNSPSLTGYQHRKALKALDASAPNDPATIEALKQVVARDGYTIEVREDALNRLAERDLEGLKTTIRRTLPRANAWGWITRLSQIIAQRGWKDLSPALVSSWAWPRPYVKDSERPEYLALVELHGAENVTDVVYQMMIESAQVGQQGLRTRCWDLLHRLGQRQRLVELLTSGNVPENDAMLLDLQAGAADLGLVPHNHEEILWLRKLREPERAEFWSRAATAVQHLSAERRVELELRDLPVLVSASLYDPELLQMSTDALYEKVHAYLREQRHHVQDSNYEGYAGDSRQLLSEYRDRLTWGDLAAIMIAVRAVQVPEVVSHVFDYAQRDQADKSTEYGGVIALDAKDRFEVLEFAPVMRRHDREFISSQAMMDAAYTSIFHFHLHVQNYRNEGYAGPSFGDINYADNVRANCLVFTFLNQNTMNVDFYRHGRVVVDLGEIKRPTVQSSGLLNHQMRPLDLAQFASLKLQDF